MHIVSLMLPARLHTNAFWCAGDRLTYVLEKIKAYFSETGEIRLVIHKLKVSVTSWKLDSKSVIEVQGFGTKASPLQLTYSHTLTTKHVQFV